MGRAHTLRTRMLAGASALAIAAAVVAGGLTAPPAAAQGYEAEQVYRQEALAHARAITEAWRRLEDHILRRSVAATSWTGSVPPAATGWLDAWTERGVRARYCEDTLLVYMEPASLKGVGRDQRSVQVAPHLYAEGDLPALHWLEGSSATGSAGRATLGLPTCLSDASFVGPLPSGRAALAGVVRDPHLQRRERVSHERTVEDCPAGSHGDGRTMTREVRQAHDGRGDAVGDPVVGSWQVLIEDCRADYTEWEHYTLDCSWLAGPPHNREMTGREIWRREKTVTTDGIAWGTPEFVSTSCWEGRTPALPQARDIGDGADGDHERRLPCGIQRHGGADADGDGAFHPVALGRAADLAGHPGQLDRRRDGLPTGGGARRDNTGGWHTGGWHTGRRLAGRRNRARRRGVRHRRRRRGTAAATAPATAPARRRASGREAAAAAVAAAAAS